MTRPQDIDASECQVQSYWQHYTEPSADPLPATNTTLSNTLLPLGSGILTHNSAGVPIIVVCAKADLIDEGHDIAAGASGIGGMVKGKGGAWEERTDGIMQVLRMLCLKCKWSLFPLEHSLTSYRWCFPILHDAPARDIAGVATICASFIIHASCTVAGH